MRPGFGTVLWGRRVDDLEYALDVIAACGFKGVELAQHHEEIFLRQCANGGVRRLQGVEELLQHLDQRGLKLIGLAGGTLKERAAFLGSYTDAYLYADHWSHDEALKVLEAGFTIAIHPHWLMPIRRLRHALTRIAKFKGGPHEGRVRLLLDTAHFTLAEDDPVDAVNVHCEKLAAVHLKGWRPDYGRWSHRYAHGFCPPDDGIVPVAAVLDGLYAKGYDGWVIMEQDHYDVGREQTALRCARWLEKHGPSRGIAISSDERRLEECQRRALVNPYFERLGRSGARTIVLDCINGRRRIEDLFRPPLTTAALSGPLSELLLGRELSTRVAHRPDPADYYAVISRSVRELLGSQCVKVWSYNPLLEDSGALTLLGIAAPGFAVAECASILPTTGPLATAVLSHPAVEQWDVRDSRYANKFSDRQWLAQLQEKAPWLLILPVFNTSNTHQLRFLITSSSAQPLLDPGAAGGYDITSNLDRLGQLDAITWIVAHWSDYLTDEICSAASGYTNHLCGNSSQGLIEFIDALSDYLQQTFDCNAVTLFLEDFIGERLEPVGNSREKLEWSGNPPYYSAADDETHTFKSWKFREMVFSAKATSGKGREKRPPWDPRDEILFAPLVRRGGKCHGVVRLHNKRTVAKPVSSMFTDDDAAKLDAIIQAALPHLELLEMQERQRESLARMVHEFQSPLVAIRGAVDLMQADLRGKGLAPSTFFRRDFTDDILQWTGLMGRLTRNARIFAGGQGVEVLRAQKTLLLSEVVMPVLRQIRPLVPEGVRFDSHQEDLQSVPPLCVDRNQMQQVFFNLLSNAIKSHSGTIRVQSCRNPTTFEIMLPQRLRYGPPTKLKPEPHERE
jgi:sugar phosphate isomerase/epimerase